jgi:hypothetical protein
MSVDFLSSIKCEQMSTTIIFQPEDEIFDKDESVLKFCKRLEEIAEEHSFVHQLERDYY